MLAALIQLEGRSSRFETGAVAGLLERRKLCLLSANLRQAPQADRAVLEMMLDAVKRQESGHEPPVRCEARQRSRMRQTSVCDAACGGGGGACSAVGRGAGNCCSACEAADTRATLASRRERLQRGQGGTVSDRNRLM
jgi:hypothetical protein